MGRRGRLLPGSGWRTSTTFRMVVHSNSTLLSGPDLRHALKSGLELSLEQDSTTLCGHGATWQCLQSDVCVRAGVGVGVGMGEGEGESSAVAPQLCYSAPQTQTLAGPAILRALKVATCPLCEA